MDFMGLEGFVWFQGIVEDVNDPKKLGRVKVRIFGIHSQEKQKDDTQGVGIPTEDLPWAYPLQSINSAGVSGVGEAPVGIVPGSTVIGFARDGKAYQDLVIMGTVGGIPQKEADTESGFNDPNGEYPRYTKEPDTNRLARNETIEETIVQAKKDSKVEGVETPNGSWDEPETPYNAEYPMNSVEETRAGHIFERDDTENAERLHKYHKSGTFEEEHPDGSRVEKIVKDDYEIVMGDDFVYIKGNSNSTVDGDTNIYIKGDSNVTVDGNTNLHIKGNVTQKVDGNVEQTIEGNSDASVSGNLTTEVQGNTTVESQGEATVESLSSTYVKGSAVILNSESGGGTVCQLHTCAFTGMPHPEGSSTVSGEL